MKPNGSDSRRSSAQCHHATVLLAALLSMLVSVRTASANWPFNSNVNVPLCTATGDQRGPKSVSDGNGGAIVVWMDARNILPTGGGTGNDIYAAHVAASGLVDAAWPVDGVAICTAPGDQLNPIIASDGAGGAIITWFDGRSSNTSVYAQRVSATGVPLWAANGVPLCTSPGSHYATAIISDGAGGTIVAWYDSHISAQRVNAAGVPQWGVSGVQVCGVAGGQSNPTMTPDGAGGAIVSWNDLRSGTDYDIYAQRVNSAGASQWAPSGVALCTAAGDQTFPLTAGDGAGGATVTWIDYRSGSNSDVYAQRVDAGGTAKWSPGGVAICTQPGSQTASGIVSDGAGGAIITWGDFRSGTNIDVYAQRVGAGGPVWTPDGVALCTASGDQGGPVSNIVPDGAGGAIVTWRDFRSGTDYDVYAQRVLASGIVPSSWPVNGRVISSAANSQSDPCISTDYLARPIIAWIDIRNGTNWDIYAQLLSPSGFLAVPNPVLRPIGDVLWDQGGFVKVRWDASYLDTDEPYVVDHYWVLRSAPSNRITSALAEGRVLTPGQFGAASAAAPLGGAVASAAREIGPNALVVTVTGANSYYWEPLTRIDALHAVSGYSYVAPTTSDSTAGGNPLTAFMVIAYDYSGTIYLPSDPDSGYSVDNLPPGTPGHVTANASAGATHLHWDPNADPDLANYRVYRGSSASFTPNMANLIASPPDTGFTDVRSPGSYYKLSAVDIHRNEGGFALLSPSGTTDVGGAPALALSLACPSPNPAHGAARIGFSLPNETRVSLTIYDIAGRRERVLVDGVLPAGEHTQRWDLRDEAGSNARAGLYFVRLEAEGRRLTQRLVVSGE